MKKGFTLAEVLITLVIIGIVAAITIPTMINTTDDREYKAAYKKAMSSLNQALALDRAINGTDYGAGTMTTTLLTDAAAKNLNIINRVAAAGLVTATYSATGPKIFTADGVSYDFTGGSCEAPATAITKVGANSTAPTSVCSAIVDVNGDGKPNTFGKDQYYVVISTAGAIPGNGDAKDALSSPQ